MKRAVRGTMRHLGVMRGSGTLSCGGVALGAAGYDIDGFCTKPGEVVGSGEISMAPAELANAFGRRDLELTTDDGRVSRFVLRQPARRQGRRGACRHHWRAARRG